MQNTLRRLDKSASLRLLICMIILQFAVQKHADFGDLSLNKKGSVNVSCSEKRSNF